MIGDPVGQGDERKLLDDDASPTTRAGIRAQLERFFAIDDGRRRGSSTTLDWPRGLRLLDFLRDVGKHFTVNHMMAKDSVKPRFESREHGISYTEFSYMLLQAYDFLELYRRTAAGCRSGRRISGATSPRASSCPPHEGGDASSA